MTLNKKWYSISALKLDFDCPWKAEIYFGTTVYCFLKTAILHL